MIQLAPHEAEFLYGVIEQLTGSCQHGQYRKDILVRNVEHRLHFLGLNSLEEYMLHLDQNEQELLHFMSAITIHTTSWFREKPHFHKLEKYLINNISLFQNRYCELLSVACSTGEEIFSLALLMESIRMQYPFFDYRLTGTDIDPVSIDTAKRAVFNYKYFSTIPERYHPFLIQGKNSKKNLFTLRKEIRRRCSFRVEGLNQTDNVDRKKYDIIFCRNVLIYFSPESVAQIVRNLTKKMHTSSILTLGHSEALLNPQDYNLQLNWNSSYSPKTKLTPAVKTPELTSIKTVAPRKNNILVVDDSKTIQRVLKDLFEKHNFNVFSALNTIQANEWLEKQSIDLISLDLHMPGEDGITWLNSIRAKKIKTPVVVITETSEAEATKLLGALESGAQDYINKSMLQTDKDRIIENINALIETSHRPKGSIRKDNVSQDLFHPDLILIGASTGGTEALSCLLRNFPADTPPVLVVQHISSGFAKPFAERLARISNLKLCQSQKGEKLEPGTIYLAFKSYHIGVTKSGGVYRLTTSDQDPVNRHRPSVEFLFNSALKFGNNVAAILLTGMGKDGSMALYNLKQQGAMTFAQDEESSVVFGMPGEAVRLGAAGFIGNLGEIRSECEKFLKLKKN